MDAAAAWAADGKPVTSGTALAAVCCDCAKGKMSKAADRKAISGKERM
jgi:hypothetical protein